MKKQNESPQVSFTFDEDLLRAGHITYDVKGPELDDARYTVSKYPYNSVPQLEFSVNGMNSFGISSGVVIGPHTILTASHSMFPNGKRADDWDIFMRYSDNHFPNPGSSEPLATKSRIHYFNVGRDGTMTRGESEWDYAVINTAHKFSSWFGIMTEYSGGKTHMTGYPGVLNGRQEDVTGRVDRHSKFDVLDYENFHARPGNSGGPIWVDKNPGPGVKPYVVGIVSTTDWASLISNETFQQIKKWVKADGYSLGKRVVDERWKQDAAERRDDDESPRSDCHDLADTLDLLRDRGGDDDVGSPIGPNLLAASPDLADFLLAL